LRGIGKSRAMVKGRLDPFHAFIYKDTKAKTDGKETSASVRVEMNRCGSEHNRGIPPWLEKTERTGLSGGCRVTGIPTTTKSDEIL